MGDAGENSGYVKSEDYWMGVKASESVYVLALKVSILLQIHVEKDRNSQRQHGTKGSLGVYVHVCV